MAHKHQREPEYEKIWQDAFENAEIKPPASLWNNLDHQLTKQETGRYRRGFLFYRSVAAACLLCLAAMGIYSANRYFSQDQPAALSATETRQGQESEQRLKNSVSDNASSDAAPGNNLQPPKATGPTAAAEAAAKRSEVADHEKNKNAVSGTTPPVADLSPVTGKAFTNKSFDAHTTPGGLLSADNSSRTEVPPYLSSIRPGQHVTEVNRIAQVEQLYHVPNPYAKVSAKEEKQQPTFYAGINVGSNYFDPNISTGPVAASNMLMNADRHESFYSLQSAPPRNTLSMEDGSTSVQEPGVQNTPRVSLSYGADIGMRISKHLVLESGLDYGRFNTSTQTYMATENISSGRRYPIVASNIAENRNISYTEETELLNSFELLSLPVKIGYYLDFNKMNVFVSSGLAANFFLSNNISDVSGTLSTVRITSDIESPYQNVFYSGLVNAGVSYNFLGNYSLSIAPEYNFSLTEMTKTGAFFSSQPYLFSIDVGIKYLFR